MPHRAAGLNTACSVLSGKLQFVASPDRFVLQMYYSFFANKGNLLSNGVYGCERQLQGVAFSDGFMLQLYYALFFWRMVKLILFYLTVPSKTKTFHS